MTPKCIVPRLLFLDSYIYSKDKINWSCASGTKVHYVGSLILQLIFKYRSQYIHPYITSITTMESDHVIKVVKDARVIQSFLSSNASNQQKTKLVGKNRNTCRKWSFIQFLSTCTQTAV